MGQQDVWDSFYRSNGRAWRGNCRMPDPLGGGGDALDLGCGSGKSVSTLIDMGYRAVGLDFSEEAVSMCRERFGGAAEFVAGDFSVLETGLLCGGRSWQEKRCRAGGAEDGRRGR